MNKKHVTAGAMVIIVFLAMNLVSYGVGYNDRAKEEKKEEMRRQTNIEAGLTPEERVSMEMFQQGAYKKIGYEWGHALGACEAMFKCAPDTFKEVGCLKIIKDLRPIILEFEPDAKLNPELQKELDK